MDNSLKTRFTSGANWISHKEAVVFGIFEGEDMPCGLGFTKETAERQAAHLFPVFSHIRSHLALKDFSPKFGKTAVLYPHDALFTRVILVGLGKKDELDAERVRQAAAHAVARAEHMGARKISFTLFGAPGQRAPERLRYLCEGAALSLWKFDAYKTAKQKEPSDARVEEVEFLLPEILSGDEVKQMQKDLEKHLAIAEAVYFARNITNQPASVVTPAYLVSTAETLAPKVPYVSFQAFGKKELEDRGMNGVLAVGKGSDNEPALIVLEYNPPSTNGAHVPTVALVGKGVCFDSGGISLKPADNMDEMKMDMAGAAAVIATVLTAAKLALPVRVVAVAPVVENLPSSKSYRPGDIIKTASGKTIEVLNTDAEGRVILSDALHFAVTEYKPDHVIDLATLTGACVVALGAHYAALFTNDHALAQRLSAAGEKTGEKVWRMPLDESYKKQIESHVADVKNTGGRPGGSITAALFLKEFIGDHKSWAHIDIAGTAMLPEAHGYKPKGGSGFGVRLLLEFLEQLN